MCIPHSDSALPPSYHWLMGNTYRMSECAPVEKEIVSDDFCLCTTNQIHFERRSSDLSQLGASKAIANTSAAAGTKSCSERAKRRVSVRRNVDPAPRLH